MKKSCRPAVESGIRAVWTRKGRSYRLEEPSIRGISETEWSMLTFWDRRSWHHTSSWETSPSRCRDSSSRLSLMDSTTLRSISLGFCLRGAKSNQSGLLLIWWLKKQTISGSVLLMKNNFSYESRSEPQLSLSKFVKLISLPSFHKVSTIVLDTQKTRTSTILWVWSVSWKAEW